MKVIALNSSARVGKSSKTQILLEQLVEGMRQAGAEVEIVNLKDKKIKNCVGCFTCWTKTPGQCILQDDMTNGLFAKWLEADICIYATPLFHHTVNATMKTFLERTLPYVEPYMQLEGERWVHPLRSKPPSAVILSVAGFPELSAFGALSHYVNFLFGQGKTDRLLAEIYRPGAEYLQRSPRRNDVLEAVKEAGRELVESGSVSSRIMERIERPLTTNDDVGVFAKVANCTWQSCIAEKMSPMEFFKQGGVPRPDTIDTFMAVFSQAFNPENARDTKAALQFVFNGQDSGTCHFTIQDQGISAQTGPAENPDLVVKSPFEVWMDIMTGKVEGAQMMMEGKYTAEGDMNLLMNLSQFFS